MGGGGSGDELIPCQLLNHTGLHSRSGLDASRVVQTSQSVFQRLDRSGKDTLQGQSTNRNEGKTIRDITVETKRSKQQPDARSRLVVVKSSKTGRSNTSVPRQESSMVADKLEQRGKTAVHLRVDRTRLGVRKEGSF